MCYNIDMKSMNELTYNRGLLVRAYLSDRQKICVKKNGGVARFVYNRLVAVDREKHKLVKTLPYSPADHARMSYLKDAYATTTSLRNAVPFLNDPLVDGYAIANAKKDYSRAWQQFKKVKGTGIPTFRKKDNNYSYGTNCHYDKKLNNDSTVTGLYEGSVRFIDKSHVILPILGRVRIKGSDKEIKSVLNRKDFTRIGTVRITLDSCGNAYLSFSLASDTPFHTVYPQTKKAVGMDMNLTNFLYDSDGEEIPSPKFLRKAEAKLKKEQRKLSRKLEAAKRDGRDYRTCKNYQEQRLKAAEIHKHVANQRLDFIRRVANWEVKNHDYLFAEDLKVRNLIKNHRLAQAISDSGWRKFLTECVWCSSKRGKIFLLIDPKNTTQTCSNCGYVSHGDTRITLDQEEWDCPQCGTHHIRDYNAAVNIKNTGLLVLKEAGVPIALS